MKFSKMHGLGNDFMVVDAITQKVFISCDIVRRLSDRYYGIGFDQLLIIERANSLDIDFNYRIFNANGTEVNQCGNGIRCFAHFVRMKKLTAKNKIYVTTKNRLMIVYMLNNGLIRVNMGEPDFNPKNIPFAVNNTQKTYILHITKGIIECSVVSIGNPHCIVMVDNIDDVEVSSIGIELSKHYLFPEEVNVGFMQIINCKSIRLRVYERGVGETKSCGSGACAAVAVGIYQGLLLNEVYVDLLGGKLFIDWKGITYPLYMVGHAIHVYDGNIDI